MVVQTVLVIIGVAVAGIFIGLAIGEALYK